MSRAVVASSAAAACALALFAASPSARAESVCFSDWSAASAVVRHEGLITIEQLVALAPSKLGGEIVRTTLCQERQGFVYRLVVRQPSGQLHRVTIDAKKPFAP
jgi:uncharacterized membrane protein YkoI